MKTLLIALMLTLTIATAQAFEPTNETIDIPKQTTIAYYMPQGGCGYDMNGVYWCN